MSFSSLLWFSRPWFYCFGSVSPLSWTSFLTLTVLSKKSSDNPSIHYIWPSIKRWKNNKISNSQFNIMEELQTIHTCGFKMQLLFIVNETRLCRPPPPWSTTDLKEAPLHCKEKLPQLYANIILHSASDSQMRASQTHLDWNQSRELFFFLLLSKTEPK